MMAQARSGAAPVVQAVIDPFEFAEAVDVLATIKSGKKRAR